MQDIKLIALDLDGTLFNPEGIISKKDLDAIKRVTNQGVTVVISTGRPYSGLPFEQLKDTGIKYSINTNGSAAYEIGTKKCIFEESMENDISFPIIDFLLTKDIHFDAFIQGQGYSPTKCLEPGKKLDYPKSLLYYVLETRTRVDNLCEYIKEHDMKIQKMTLNFYKDVNGNYVDRDEVEKYLLSNSNISVVSGGFNNLEFTRSDVDKGTGLREIADKLGIPVEQTMAIGDSGNDLAIIKAASVGIAMGNASEYIKEAADYVTLSNEASGGAAAINHFIN